MCIRDRTTYFTDIGITAALVAIVALITKVWDAINDPIFGMIMDKVCLLYTSRGWEEQFQGM